MKEKLMNTQAYHQSNENMINISLPPNSYDFSRPKQPKREL